MKSVYLVASLVALSSIAKAETIVDRGQYLVTTIGACGNCHTPREGELIGGKIIPGTELGWRGIRRGYWPSRYAQYHPRHRYRDW
jgi:mono/diheme cytochrome c family protein